MNPAAGSQRHSDDPLLAKDPVLTPHTDKLTLNADLLATEGPPLQLIPLKFLQPSQSPSPNLHLSLSLSIEQGRLGVGVHIMAANRQSLDSANIAVISAGQEYTH